MDDDDGRGERSRSCRELDRLISAMARARRWLFAFAETADGQLARLEAVDVCPILPNLAAAAGVFIRAARIVNLHEFRPSISI